MTEDIIVGLDIGTANIRVVVAEKNENGDLQIIGTGCSKSSGMRKGAVVNIEETVKGVYHAIEEAEMMSSIDIDRCIMGLGGIQIDSINSKGIYPVSDKGKNNREIHQEDINSVIESAKAMSIPMDREIIHVIPQSFIVDGQRNIKDPINMIGVRLEAEVHVITGSVTAIKNIVMCANRANLHVINLMHYGLADVKSVMTKEEQELGAVLIDIGAGTTDIVVMKNGAPIFTSCLSVGAAQVTNDLALVKSIPADIAEKIKVSNGCCWRPFVEDDEQVLLPGIGGRSPEEISKIEICNIFQARMQEIFLMAKAKINSMNKSFNFTNSIILCGGGALLNGATDLASEVFGGATVRLGIPSTIGGLTGEYRSPEFAAVIGLVLREYESNNKNSSMASNRGDNSGAILEKMKNFFKEFF